MVDYLPEIYSLTNHTMNIVLENTKRAHILDTRYHCIGEKIDNRSIKLNYKGLTHTDFIQREFAFHTYYETNYFEGLNLLEFETHMGIDIITSALYGASCNEHIEYFKQFQLENQKNYNKVVDNLNILEKRIRW